MDDWDQEIPNFLGFGIVMCVFEVTPIQTDGEPRAGYFGLCGWLPLSAWPLKYTSRLIEGSRSRFLAATLGLSSLGLLYGLLEPRGNG